MSSGTFNFSICFIVLVFVGSSIASPSIPRARRDISNDGNYQPSVDFAESVKHISTKVENWFKNVTNNSEFILRNVDAIVDSVLKEGIFNVATWAVDLMLRMEFLFMADGSHYMFPLNADADLEVKHRIVAISVSKLLMNLKTAERTDKLIKNATRNLLVNEDLQVQFKTMKSAREVFEKLLQSYFEALNHLFEIDSELAVDYKKEKTQAQELVKPGTKMREPLRKSWNGTVEYFSLEEVTSFLQNKNVFHQACMNKMFLKQAEKHFTMIFSPTHHKRYMLARTLISMARSSDFESEINEIYHQALTLASEDVSSSYDDICDTLFSSIEKILESKPELLSEVSNIMKQVEKNTVYNLDMLHIDFSLL